MKFKMKDFLQLSHIDDRLGFRVPIYKLKCLFNCGIAVGHKMAYTMY